MKKKKRKSSKAKIKKLHLDKPTSHGGWPEGHTGSWIDKTPANRSLRDKLCKKEKTWQAAFSAKDWVVDQIRTLRTLTESDISTKAEIKEGLVDILIVLDPDLGGDNAE